MSQHVESRGGIRGWVNENIWNLLPPKYQNNVQPEDIEDSLLPGEEAQTVIYLAWYRDTMSRVVFDNFWLIFLFIVVVALLLYFVFANILVALIPFGVLVVVMILTAREYIEYKQWRLVKTSARIIITMPQRGAWPLVDTIEMQGLPKVIDTNWSPNALWRVFQFFTGARDMYISLAAFKFESGTAKVKDAIIIPDVMPQDVRRLKELVFTPG